jgi:hypothetical protein
MALKQSLQTFDTVDNDYEIAKTKLALVQLAIETNSTDDSMADLKQALKTFKKRGARGYLAQVRTLEKTLQSSSK